MCIHYGSTRLPANSNFRLLDHWKKVVSSCQPIIIFCAPAVKQKGVAFDYISYIQRQCANESQVMVQVIQGADHTFANRRGRAAVREYTEAWLDAHFPIIKNKKHELLKSLQQTEP